MHAAFVGRDVELQALVDLCRGAVARGSQAAAVIVGEPGSGKSRLLAVLEQQLASIERIASGGYEPERAVPFAAARDLLVRLATVGHGDRLSFGASPGVGPVDQLQLFEATSGHWYRSGRSPCSSTTCSGSTRRRCRSPTTSFGLPPTTNTP